jgi:hypothetical protein
MNFDANGNGASSFQYPDGTVLPTGQVECTQAQYQAPSQWTLVSGSLVQSLSAAQSAQSALIKQGFANAVAAIPFTINGVSYTLDAAQSKQPADMAIVVAANNALNHPVAWVASTSVAQYAVQLVGSSYLFCTVAGTTGTTAPTPPTTFGTPITDGGVTWELYGRTLELSDGSHATFTVQELVSIFQQVELYIHYQKNKKLSLLDSIAAVTSSTTDPIATVQAIVW